MASGGHQDHSYTPVDLQHPDDAAIFSGGRHARAESLMSEQSYPSQSTLAYPPQPYDPPNKHISIADYSGSTSGTEGVDPEKGRPSRRHRRTKTNTPNMSGGTSWDLLGGLRRFEHRYEEFDPRNAGQEHLAFAEGDMPQGKLSRLYNYLINVSVITRWTLFIVPIMGLLWIPGILGLTIFPHAKVWGVKFLWWSIWLSVVWGGWWTALAAARLLPHIARGTVGAVAVTTRRYIDWLSVLHRYVAFFSWSCAVWLAFTALIVRQEASDISDSSRSLLSTFAKLFFAIFICAGVLAFEKFSIQWIAGKFHERSYAERIAEQKTSIKILTTLYRHSSDIPGRSDTLRDGPTDKRASVNPKRLFKKALKGVRTAATTTTTALGNVASEMAGSSVLQPNSPEAKVKMALESANKSRLLARRLYYSFVRPGHHYLTVDDVARFFPTRGDAEVAFALFDKDDNGDVTRDEVELACMECHREQLSIEHSMKDLDSAVGRLDNIFMSLYVIICILIIAVALDTQVTTLITGAGTVIIGLSWLIGNSLQEVLTSIIFLFIKHPYDVGDRVDIEKESYTVKEIRLLTTVFLDSNACLVLAPNTVLNSLYIRNIRRSPQMSETFQFDVAYETKFEDIEHLRTNMLAFLEGERRDFIPIFDVAVVDIPEQEKMTLKVDIKYRSNWQQGSLRAQRRNKWICALKTCMADCHVYGPEGPREHKSPTPYTLVPWEEVKHGMEEKPAAPRHEVEPRVNMPLGGWNLSSNNALIADDSEDVFGESDELHMTTPRRGMSTATTATTGTPSTSRAPSLGMPMPPPITLPQLPMVRTPEEEIEMKTPRVAKFPQP